ncbi:MAG: hypothetical protein KGJ14_08920, partial [Nitrospirota bacterium]|nr:hypothetical protein [Nitrospirota bacterium]
TMSHVRRLLLIGLLLVLAPQFIALGWAGPVEHPLDGESLPVQDPFAKAPVETEEVAEDGDDRLTWPVEVIVAENGRALIDGPLSSLCAATAIARMATLAHVFFRPPILL